MPYKKRPKEPRDRNGRGDDRRRDSVRREVSRESAAKALQGVGSELVAGLIDLGPISGAKTASYLLLEARAAVQCGKAKDAAYSARAETVRARVPFRRHRRDYATPSTRPLRSRTGPRKRAAMFGELENFEAWHRAARLLTGVREACCSSSGRTALIRLRRAVGVGRRSSITKAGVATPRVGVSGGPDARCARRRTAS